MTKTNHISNTIDTASSLTVVGFGSGALNSAMGVFANHLGTGRQTSKKLLSQQKYKILYAAYSFVEGTGGLATTIFSGDIYRFDYSNLKGESLYNYFITAFAYNSSLRTFEYTGSVRLITIGPEKYQMKPMQFTIKGPAIHRSGKSYIGDVRFSTSKFMRHRDMWLDFNFEIYENSGGHISPVGEAPVNFITPSKIKLKW